MVLRSIDRFVIAAPIGRQTMSAYRHDDKLGSAVPTEETTDTDTMASSWCAPSCESKGKKSTSRFWLVRTPIENVYAKLKSDLRKGTARTVDVLSRLIGRSLKAIAPAERADNFRHAGYHA